MTILCDVQTRNHFSRIIGMHFERLLMQRFPGSSAYRKAIIQLVGLDPIQIDLFEQQISAKFEVFVLRARGVSIPDDLSDWDQIRLGNFNVNRVDVLKREEWIERRGTDTSCANDQIEVDRETTIVESGVSIISTLGATLIFDADSFPLLIRILYRSDTNCDLIGAR